MAKISQSQGNMIAFIIGVLLILVLILLYLR